MKIPFINEYKWKELEQAYGSAEDAPVWLSDLTSQNEDIRDEAIYEFLHSQACHQYTTYSCTPPTVRCVIFVLSNHAFEDAGALFEIINFLQACTYNARKKEDLRQEILKGINCYRTFSLHSDDKIKLEAQKLIEFCNEFRVNVS